MEIEWIEPAVKERVVEVIGECDEYTAKNHDVLINIINGLRSVLPKSESSTLLTLEDLYLRHQSVCIDFGYRRGLNDGLQIYKLCNEKRPL